MSTLPDELWRLILDIGVRSPNPTLTYRDLCCLSISSRRFHRLSSEDSLWSRLLSSDFPPPPPSSSAPSTAASSLPPSSQSLYRIRFERDRDRKLAAHRRAVLRKESQIAEHSKKLSSMEASLALESDKLKTTAAELSNLQRVRQASVALNVWQPHVVRGRQKSLVEQCTVPVESQIRALEMDLRVCKMQISMLRKSYEDERRRLDVSKQELESIKYHPFRDYEVHETSGKRKKIKRCTESEGKTS
ncbi:F-box protein SKIP24 [Punica granatum]|uniref:Uncharacterized protein n=2 Tax=Punica granatum TaxID=22663 RepID=A0A2I0HTC0_PUNGR|nr:F-box protein SKIP24 [Punica granatum]PKI34958.1 hypothetical protein CRG98_044664 [Punica granatum]